MSYYLSTLISQKYVIIEGLRKYLKQKNVYLLLRAKRKKPHQRRGGSAFKTGRWEVPDAIPDRACRLSFSEFPVVFSETCVNTGKDPLERPRRRVSHP